MPFRLAMASLALSLSLASACEMEEPEEEIILSAEIEMGVSVDGEGFYPTEQGSDQVLEYGAQGGMHLQIMPRFRGASGVVYLERSARLVEDGKLVLRSPTMVIDLPADADESWWHQPFALTNFMCPTPVGIQLYDREVEFTYELRDKNDKVLARDSLILMPRCPSDVEEFCHDVCSGN